MLGLQNKWNRLGFRSGFTWIGSAERAAVGGSWKQLTLSLDVPESVEGHTLDVSILFEGAAQYLLDEIALGCTERLFMTLLDATFETSDALPLKTYVHRTPDTISTAAAAAPKGTDLSHPSFDLSSVLMGLEAPSSLGAHRGSYGAVVRLHAPFATSTHAKVRLTKLTAVAGIVNVSLWAKALPGGASAAGAGLASGSSSGKKGHTTHKKSDGARALSSFRRLAAITSSFSGVSNSVGRELEAADAPTGPFVSIDLLDESTNFEWLGAWQRTYLSTTTWTRVEALIHVDDNRAGHSLDAALVVGGAYPGVLIDDVIVAAPPIVGGGIPVRAMTLTFDDDASVSHIGVVHTAGAVGSDTRLGGGTSLRVQLRSPHAALSGSAGAMINVLSPLAPPASARLVLCHLTTQMPGVVKIVLWARSPSSHPAPRVSVDLFDVTSSWEWLGTPDDFKLTTEWQRIEVTHQLSASRVGHRIELGLQLARSAGILLIDDLEVWAPQSAEGNPPRVMPPPLPATATAER